MGSSKAARIYKARIRGYFIMSEDSSLQEYLTILNLHAASNVVSDIVKVKSIEQKEVHNI